LARTREFMLRPTPGAPVGFLSLRNKLDVAVHTRVTSELGHQKKQIHINAVEYHDGACESGRERERARAKRLGSCGVGWRYLASLDLA
jgi:hypothetical protein